MTSNIYNSGWNKTQSFFSYVKVWIRDQDFHDHSGQDFFYLVSFLTFILYWCIACLLSHFSPVWLFATLWTVACQAPLSIEFSRLEYWSGLPCPPPGNLPDPGIKRAFLISPALAGRFFTISTTWEAPELTYYHIKSSLNIDSSCRAMGSWVAMLCDWLTASHSLHPTPTLCSHPSLLSASLAQQSDETHLIVGCYHYHICDEQQSKPK